MPTIWFKMHFWLPSPPKDPHRRAFPNRAIPGPVASLSRRPLEATRALSLKKAVKHPSQIWTLLFRQHHSANSSQCGKQKFARPRHESHAWLFYFLQVVGHESSRLGLSLWRTFRLRSARCGGKTVAVGHNRDLSFGSRQHHRRNTWSGEILMKLLK